MKRLNKLIVMGTMGLALVAGAPPIAQADMGLVQYCLRSLGMYRGEVTGRLDAATANAMITWGRYHKIDVLEMPEEAGRRLAADCALKDPTILKPR